MIGVAYMQSYVDLTQEDTEAYHKAVEDFLSDVDLISLDQYDNLLKGE
ncbi:MULTISPECIES: hypothetical protein [Bacillaceae]|uniref:Uncharacterized protein n=1 Tax=Evansella alkalicola TaxID=745819 RepID=A0ABS6JZY1_9BACI|nr:MULTISPECIES: hypothetical protein [Bacillaceae]MBU9724148.1 hypothetical protein [Bacillus alkalicola]